MGDLPAAYLAYTAARDADALAVRADSRLNQIIRETARKHASNGVHLTDLVERVGLSATGSIPGRNFFYEHVHFNPVGNVEIARLLADAVYAMLPPDMRATATAEWAGPTVSQRVLAVTLWDQHRLWLEMAQRQSQPPFTNRLNHQEEIAYCLQRETGSRTSTKTKQDRGQDREQDRGHPPKRDRTGSRTSTKTRSVRIPEQRNRTPPAL